MALTMSTSSINSPEPRRVSDRSPILDLPPELRNMVHCHPFAPVPNILDESKVVKDIPDGSLARTGIPNKTTISCLLLTNRHTHQEVESIIYHYGHFVISMPTVCRQHTTSG